MSRGINSDSARQDNQAENFNTWNGQGAYNPFPGPQGAATYLSVDDSRFSGGGGGGGYSPPVAPNPTYIPPSFNTNGVIILSLDSQTPASHTENDKIIGVGPTALKTYTFNSFGQSKTYKSNVGGKTPLNYYVVSIRKKFTEDRDIDKGDGNIGEFFNNSDTGTNVDDTGPRTTILNNDQTGRNTQTLVRTNLNYGVQSDDKLEKRFAQVVSVKEYELSANGKYVFKNEKTYDIKYKNSIGAIFGFEKIKIDLKFNFKDGKPEVRPESKRDIIYSILFNGNYKSELGDKVTLSYNLVNNNDNTLVRKDSIELSDDGNDPETISEELLKISTFKFRVDGVLPGAYSVNSVYYTNKKVDYDLPFDKIDFSKWNKTNTKFDIPGINLQSQLYVYVVFDKEIEKIIPTVSLPNNIFTVEVKDSDNDKSVIIPFQTTQSDTVDAFLENGKIIKVNASDGLITLSFKNDFNARYGVQKVKFVANNNQFKTISNGLTALVNFLAIDNFPSIIQTTAPAVIDIPSFSDGNIEYEVIYKSADASSVDIDLVLKDKTRITLYKNAIPNNKIKINIKDLANNYPGWNGSDNVTLIVKPYSRGGEKELIGNEYQIVTSIKYPGINLDETMITKAVYDAFVKQLKFDEPEKESKYLTHLLNLDNDERVLISAYEEDNWTLSEREEDDLGNIIVKKEVETVILRLYSPLPPNVSTNDTIWITKLITNPLIETLVLNEQDDKEAPFIKGPNFNIDIDFVKGSSTNYESLDDLILSASSSTNLIQKYLSGSNIANEDLNIEYAIGSISASTAQYQWENFTHFSSAVERINNFVYKLQLIDGYEDLILSSSTDFTGGGSAAWTGSLSVQQEVERQKAKKRALIQGFDGFETFLYTSSSKYTTTNSSSITWPYNSGTRLKTTNAQSVGWYNNIIGLASNYDIQNPNYIVNNIPQYITTNLENENFLLFFSMIGHHFDIIYYYTKAIENSRGLGYKNKNEISDRLLYDYLKSFSWDAKNLGTSAQLWEYVYGEDINGNTKVTTPVKDRTNEVWRRILNNLPYLLKHKGTRRGIHALMACYGIPSSNLSIIEFGGPEPAEDTISKLLIDDKSYALKFNTSTQIEVPWTNTNQNRKSDTIELFVKPAYSGQWGLFGDGTRFVLTLSGSVDSKYGKVILRDGNPNIISSSLLPIFNDRYFGVSVVRTLSGSQQLVELNVMQTEGDREIFSSFTSASYTTGSSYWNQSDTLFFGNDPNEAVSYGYSGSIDEIRLWATPLSRSRFEEHVYYPEMINGNHISSSTTDLHFRLDFEYPKNVSVLSTMPNVAAYLKYSGSFNRNDYEDGLVSYNTIIKPTPTTPVSASLSGFTSVTTYPYQFELIDRNGVLEIPSLGASRYSTNKIRFSSQSLVADLSVNSRSTIKSYEYAPIDSNRVGVFVSPMKELNFDIAKSLGSNNLDDYVGDPADIYKDSYSELNKLKKYYFERVKNPDIYEYINIIKSYEQSMFDDIKDMLPARTKATTGLLIEPHFLERSKYKHEKPTGLEYYNESEIKAETTILAENNQYESIIDANKDTELIGENNQYESIIDANKDTNLFGENNQLDTIIDANEEIQTTGENNQYETIVNAKLDEGTKTKQKLLNFETNKLLASEPYQDVAFSTLFHTGSAIRNYYDRFGNLKKERIKGFIVYETDIETYLKFAEKITYTDANGQQVKVGDPRAGFVEANREIIKKNILIIPFTGSQPLDGAPLVGSITDRSGSILSVDPINGYLPTHYKFVGDLTTGLQNSYFKGSKNTRATTLDGSSPVESFISNPNAIRVLPGRNSTEPIIESDN